MAPRRQVRYDLAGLRSALTKAELARRPPDLWRYRELLPVRRPDDIVSLGEAMTPLVRLPNLANAIEQGAQQAFRIDDDGKGYVQEVAIPWKLLTADGTAPPAGSEVRIAVEPNFTAGPFGRVSIKDIFREGIVVDRVFTFRAYDQWGTGVLEKEGRIAPAPEPVAQPLLHRRHLRTSNSSWASPAHRVAAPSRCREYPRA